MIYGKDDEYFCRVCGLRQDTPPWGGDGQCPTYEICSCCGVEFGYEDSSLEWIRECRSGWRRNGFAWSDPEEKPDAWDPRIQMTQIPEQYV